MSFRIEKDSLGEVKVPSNALYSAQTQRAIDNFPISFQPLPSVLIQAIASVKHASATTNEQLGKLSAEQASAIRQAAQEIIDGQWLDQFPIDVFQTGSGTSSNMNVNEVIATRASQLSGLSIHPNDHVNMAQSSNDTFPSAIHIACVQQIHQALLPALAHLQSTIEAKAVDCQDVVKTGRTHLMDAMPVRMGQELSGWAQQIANNRQRIENTLPQLCALAQGGTAVGTGVNAHAEFGARFAQNVSELLALPFTSAVNKFEALSSLDSVVSLSGQLKTLAASLSKIANDLRWMNAGPLAGLAEISLPDLQPGSSIMPGKINPVIPEATLMVCAQVMGNDVAINIGGQSGSFQLNVMLPMMARNILESIQLLSNVMPLLADKAIAGFTVNHKQLEKALAVNPILVTALNSVVGYEKGAQIAKEAYKTGEPIIDVALRLTDMDRDTLTHLMDPKLLTGA
ncbi:MAG: class II fumarate hydratase [Thiotrichales bacterium]|nr:MAG: class II fumarate hydratase [Thiotrichales bacterium]